MSEDEVVKIGTATMRGREVFTPHKKRKAKVAVEDAASPSGSERSFENINYIPLRSEDDPSTQWTAVAINLEWLHKAAITAKRGRNDWEDTLADEVTNLEARIGELKAIVGERPSKLGTATAFSCLMDHYSTLKDIEEVFALVRLKITEVEDSIKIPTGAVKAAVMGELEISLNPILDDLRHRLTLLEGNFTPLLDDLTMRVGALEAGPVTSAVAGVKTAVKAELYVELTAALAPLRHFFGKFSTQMQTPGDKLDQQISSLTSGLARVEAMVQQHVVVQGLGGATMGTPGLQWPAGEVSGMFGYNGLLGTTAGLGVSGSGQGQVPSAPPFIPAQTGNPTINPGLTALERRVKQLEQQFDSQAVKIGQLIFGSRQEADVWLRGQCPGAGSHSFFVDFHSLMALAWGQGTTMGEILKLDESRTKLSYTSPEEAIIATSFYLEIPAFFGKPSLGATNSSAKILPGLPNYETWDVGDTDRGLRYDLKRKIQEQVDTWELASLHSLPIAAQPLASNMLKASAEFVGVVSSWITGFYQDSKCKGANEVETWKHISHTVREICHILHVARGSGRGHIANPNDRASCLFWGQLQSHREMQALTKAGLVGDHRLSHVLNLHLRDNAVMKSELVKVHDQLREMKKEILELKNKAKKIPGAAQPGAARAVGFARTGRDDNVE